MHQFAPTAAEDRIVTLDVLRGFALFGVLWSNLGWVRTGRSEDSVRSRVLLDHGVDA